MQPHKGSVLAGTDTEDTLRYLYRYITLCTKHMRAMPHLGACLASPVTRPDEWARSDSCPAVSLYSAVNQWQQRVTYPMMSTMVRLCHT